MTADLAALQLGVTARLPRGSVVEVAQWLGCDEDWEHPVYVSARNGDGRAFHDAVCDLAAAPLEAQVEFIVEQLLHG